MLLSTSPQRPTQFSNYPSFLLSFLQHYLLLMDCNESSCTFFPSPPWILETNTQNALNSDTSELFTTCDISLRRLQWDGYRSNRVTDSSLSCFYFCFQWRIYFSAFLLLSATNCLYPLCNVSRPFLQWTSSWHSQAHQQCHLLPVVAKQPCVNRYFNNHAILAHSIILTLLFSIPNF